ncbi:hypothetical protein DAMA08_045780 [Martiniozyma asiatica (nom. inval.)]|nr:hypothetical protein DAMA08_045780 [Martiniozyma asiatica]
MKRKLPATEGITSLSVHSNRTLYEDIDPNLIIAHTPTEIPAKRQHPKQRHLTLPFTTTPSLSALYGMSPNQLRSVHFSVFSNHGYISWHEPVDLTHALPILSDIIKFKKKTVEVYPDTMTKPQRGAGLNKPARIQLKNIWTSENKLRSLQGMKFVSYDNGVWTFDVEHFSVWGLVEDDDDDDEEEEAYRQQYAQAQQQQQHQQQQQQQQPQEHWIVPVEPKQQKLEFGEVELEVPGSIHLDEEMQVDVPIQAQFERQELKLDQQESDAFTESDFSVSDSEMVTLHSPVLEAAELVQERAFEPEIKDIVPCQQEQLLPISENWDQQLAMANSKHSIFAVTSSPMSMKAINDFLFPNKPVLAKKLIQEPINLEFEENFVQYLNREISNCVNDLENVLTPQPQIDPITQTNLMLPLFYFKDTHFESLIELSSILFDDKYIGKFIGEELRVYCENNGQGATREVKWELLARYFEKLSKVNPIGFDGLAYKLSTDESVHAHANVRIQILKTLLGQPESVSIAQRQLNAWGNNSVDKETQNLYLLLAGEVKSDNWVIGISQHIRYSNVDYASTDILNSLTNFIKSVSKAEGKNFRDHFNLLKAILIEDALEIDFFPVEFQYILLTHIPQLHSKYINKYDSICELFANKLKGKGHFKEAIHVLSHLDQSRNEKIKILLDDSATVKSLNLINDSNMNSLSKLLSIPIEWIHFSRGKYMENYDALGACWEFYKAHDFANTIKLLTEKVAPEIIIGENNKEMVQLKELIDALKDKGDVSSWRNYVNAWFGGDCEFDLAVGGEVGVIMSKNLDRWKYQRNV